MIIRLFSILDKAVEEFNVPFTSRTVAEAHRSFALHCTQEGNVKAHPRDYELYEIGTYDTSKGVVHSDEAHPRRIISAAEVIAAAKEAAPSPLSPPAS